MFSHFLRKVGGLVGWFGRPAPAAVVESGGSIWHVTPAAAAVFGDDSPDPAAWEAAGLGVLVKQNLQRTVRRFTLPGGTVYVKECRVNTPRSWAREILRPAKARLEFENAVTLRALGVPAIEPLAWGSASRIWPGASTLVTRGEDGTVPFLDVLESPPSAADGHRLAREFGRALARMHDAGIAHPDPHPGNFLVEWLPGGPPRFVLTDLHAVHFGRPLGPAETSANLTLLNRWFQLRAPRTDRLRFWQAYATTRLGRLPEIVRLPHEIERATERSNLRFWAARTARYRTDNRDSKRVRGPAASGYAVRDLPDEVVREWLADPDAPFAQPGVKLLKNSRTSTVAEVVLDTPAGPRTVIYKRFNLRSPTEAVKNLFRPSPAVRSWVGGNNVRDRGLPTACPLAVFHRHKFGVPLTGYAVTEKVPAALSLSDAVVTLDRLPAGKRAEVARVWADQLGKIVRLMHDRQVSHRDLKAPNVLMLGAVTDPRNVAPVLIDLVGVEVGRPVPPATRVRDLARLNVSFLGSTRVSRTDRLRVLQAYLGREDWKSWWRRVDVATQAKVARNARSGRPLG